MLHLGEVLVRRFAERETEDTLAFAHEGERLFHHNRIDVDEEVVEELTSYAIPTLFEDQK